MQHAMHLTDQEEQLFEKIRQLYELETIEEAIEIVIAHGIQIKLQSIAERAVQPRKS
jgi:geranylgeranyl pyrophosphate synthase